MRTKVPFGAIDKVGNNFPDLFGFKIGGYKWNGLFISVRLPGTLTARVV